jgi:hypothetical protein
VTTTVGSTAAGRAEPAGPGVEPPSLGLARLGLFALVAAFASLGLRSLGDPDLGWHLRTAQLFLSDGFVTSDPWSEASREPWVLHEWGGELVMYAAYQLGGFRGLILLLTGLMALLGWLLLRACLREARPAACAIVLVLAFVTLWPKATERPQMFSFCILAAVLPALRHAVKVGKPPWWLIPVIWVWANVHAMWPTALALYAALVLGLVLDVGVKNWDRYHRFVVIGALSGVAALLNPNGLRLLRIFDVGGAEFIGEFGPPSILRIPNLTTALMAAIVVVAWSRSTVRVPARDVSFFIAVALIGASYNRTVAVAAIALAPLAAGAISTLMPEPGRPRAHTVAPRERWALVGLLLVFVVAAAIRVQDIRPLATDRPYAATRQLDALPGRAHVLNEYTFGGWMLWAARDTSPGIDGRSEVYGLPYVQRYLASLRLAPGWQSWLEKSDFDAAWLRRSTPLVFGLKSLGWKVVRDDGNSLILVPPDTTAA